MTCKECVHHDACKDMCEFYDGHCDDLDKEINAEQCKYHKNKADVVEVVRCLNCIHFKTNINKENYCDIHSTRWDKFYVREDDYCSIGEKR